MTRRVTKQQQQRDSSSCWRVTSSPFLLFKQRIRKNFPMISTEACRKNIAAAEAAAAAAAAAAVLAAA